MRIRLPKKLAHPSSAGVTPPSKTHLRYTPVTVNPTLGTNPFLSVPPNTSNSSAGLLVCGNTGSLAGSSSSGSTSQADSFWIIFGIKDMRSFSAIENIETSIQLRDMPFFQDLKRRHRRHRWFFQRWFSPYRFRFCKFVQVRTTPKLIHHLH
jgi:hypothetical protein